MSRMTARAYVYTSRTLPDGEGTDLAGRAEVAGDLPLSLLLMLSVDPRPARSALSERGAVAARGDGVARLRELYRKAGLEDADLARWDAFWAEHPATKWLVLEAGEVDARPAKAICAAIAALAARIGTRAFTQEWRRVAADELASIAWKSALFVDFRDTAESDAAPEADAARDDAPAPARARRRPRSALLSALHQLYCKYDRLHPAREAEVEKLLIGPPLPPAAEARLCRELHDWICHRSMPAWLALVPGREALARDLSRLRGPAWRARVPALKAAARTAQDAARADEHAARARWGRALSGPARHRADDQALAGWNTEPRNATSAARQTESYAYQTLHPWLTAQGDALLTAVAHAGLAVHSLVGSHATRVALSLDPAPLAGVRRALAAALDPTAQALDAELYAWLCSSARAPSAVT